MKEGGRRVTAEIQVPAGDRWRANVGDDREHDIDGHERRAGDGRAAQRMIVKGPMLRATGIAGRRRSSNNDGERPRRAAPDRGRTRGDVRHQHDRHGQAQQAPESRFPLQEAPPRTGQAWRSAAIGNCSGHGYQTPAGSHLDQVEWRPGILTVRFNCFSNVRCVTTLPRRYLPCDPHHSDSRRSLPLSLMMRVQRLALLG
jgi:hypothetical protein